MHNAEDRGEDEGTLCAEDELEAHITLDPLSSEAWALPRFWAVGNDVSSLTMSAFETSDTL